MKVIRVLLFTFISFGLLVTFLPAQATVSETRQSATLIDGKRFISTEGGFSIEIAVAPTETTDFGTETSKKKGVDIGKHYLWKFEKTTYTIMYSPSLDSNGDPATQTLEEVSSGTRKGLLRSGAKLLSERSILFLNKYPGIEFRYITVGGDKFVNRSFLVDSTGYQVEGAFSDLKDEKEVLATLDSFKLLNDEK